MENLLVCKGLENCRELQTHCQFHACLVVLVNALTCQSCQYYSIYRKEIQKCDENRTRECKTDTKYCVTANYTDITGIVTVFRGCNEKLALCPDSKKSCNVLMDIINLTSCVASCCQTDKCNNFYPRPTSSATGIIVSKFALILMAIAGLLAS